ncbi:MAG: adenine nucleotide alpha hydrolase family protein [Pseudodesulfovibrio sp.]|uniref:PP-loop domain protein n=1 Tax=Pseudodesulfovibrio aespoeensis (strain ATCC 700646 / DSM 10631 / Aspo-2) TaxID=643562 RepID=E6VUE2_PSEA9|nr:MULTISPECIES: ATP-binding protein [Pseudodesulfovibrio]MBU4243496.1 adenine nucleotide alpha hydrolase family protein [Pseudomonadota bacterium]ADU63449.1 PP-loop domain protein [Pseudodesulfovibrio aespoeensis Aspo-2]MBU4377643.1 adenine nucleotide alpha hydrolase family protein [Pseudomonadota bacterium]MBU4473830.1 adenine nucleotide alpha hydrolase family protein [Pseudomonadota bacterium]MBU4514600.1 adenine nucleotide alpha hydrolase family protein [Pseudomonadota bacterium]
MKCSRCKKLACVTLPSHHSGFCAECYPLFFTRQVETAIRREKMFTHEERILVALSGGKDSLSLMLELAAQGYDVTGLHIDLGIPGSSPSARVKVEAFCSSHGLKLEVLEMEKEGLPIPDIKAYVNRPVCSVCGRIKRHHFNRIAMEGGYDALATGHNLDDEVARLFANTLRWDTAYLSDQGPTLPAREGFVRKVKPLFRLSEFETANYAFLKGIEIHSAACPYASGASFTSHKELWGELEHRSPGQKFQFYQGFLKKGKPAFAAREAEVGEPLAPCVECASPTSAGTCSVCRIKETVRANKAAALAAEG